MATLAKSSLSQRTGTEDSNWPKWAPEPDRLYEQITQLARKQGRDIRSFGVQANGTHDDSEAFARAIASGAAVLCLPALSKAAIRLTRQIEIRRPLIIVGEGDSSLIIWEGREPSPFLARPPDDMPTSFLNNVRVHAVRVVRPDSKPIGTAILQAYNVRNLSLTRCSTSRMGGLVVRHMRQFNRQYDRGSGSRESDPAVVSGFDADRVDDLNEDIAVYDNRIDAGEYMKNVVRFDFAKRVAVVGNQGRFANISWWGGGAKISEGGHTRFLRRVRDVYITHNTLSGANGGIYGNNGDGILVAYNDISMMTDVGIDFEGCFNALAHHNVVRNVGNFCYATFYAAKNVVFRDNYGLQDGGGTNLHLVFGKGRYGAMQGRTLLALRSAGFGSLPAAIDVSFINNHFVWTGAGGLGNCLPSYWDHLRLEGNRFENVECNLAYVRTRELEIVGNRLSFDRPGEKPVRALGGSADRTLIADNEIRITAKQPKDSIAILDRGDTPAHASEIYGNRVIASGEAGECPAVLVLPANGTRNSSVTGNRISAIHATDPSRTKADNNVDLHGRPIGITPIPEGLLAPAPKKSG